MTRTPTLVVNAVLGAMAVTVGLWFLRGDLSSSVTIVIIIGLTILYARVCPTAAHVWMWSTLLLGVESLAWPFQLIGELEQYGAEPPLEEMSKVFTAVLFGVFSGIFWLTFAYGIYRRTQPKTEEPLPLTSNQAKAQRKKKH